MKTLIQRAARWVTYRLGYQNLDFLSLLLYSRLAKLDEFVVIQIGANDGVTNDPVHDFIVRNRSKVRAIVLEPLDDFHTQLQTTYRNHSNVKTLKLAIHHSESYMELHRVDPRALPRMPAYARGIASFDAAHHTKSGTPAVDIVAERVDCITFDELIRTQDVKRLDLLCIDTEGYDVEIVKAIDFAALRPTIIMFEHGLRHAVMSETVLGGVLSLLNAHGYDAMVLDYDVVAYDRAYLGVR